MQFEDLQVTDRQKKNEVQKELQKVVKVKCLFKTIRKIVNKCNVRPSNDVTSKSTQRPHEDPTQEVLSKMG